MAATLRFLAVLALVVGAFLAGSVYGSRDRICVTADANGATVVYCANGKPAVNLESTRAARQGGVS